MNGEYYLALFDILGFEERLNEIGLEGMLEKYETLIESVDYWKRQSQSVFGELNFSEAPYWVSDGDVFIFSKVFGAYASDTILMWANRNWSTSTKTDNRDTSPSIPSPENAWFFHPIPSDNFLDACNEIMCRGIELGLPLRGGISVGKAALDQNRGIYLGKPIVESARMERGQELISASFCISTCNEIIPPRYKIPFEYHIKEQSRFAYGGSMLDWPRHWRRTRKRDIEETIEALNLDPKFDRYYKNTLNLIRASNELSKKYESNEDKSIRSQYPQFSWNNKNLKINVRQVRRIPIRKK